jgi:hypothetical protein
MHQKLVREEGVIVYLFTLVYSLSFKHNVLGLTPKGRRVTSLQNCSFKSGFFLSVWF